MGTHLKQGFTIVETMLVLAITGVLVTGLLVGVSASIANQRYRDSVATFKSFLQDQYSQVDNVSNERPANFTCTSAAKPVAVTGSDNTNPGQTGCVLLGRYITVIDGDVTTAAVVGYENSTTAAATDVQTLKDNYSFGILGSSVQTSTLEWDAKIAWPATGVDGRSQTTPRSLSILIVRSPQSGSSYTFTADTAPQIDAVSSETLKSLLVQSLTTTPGQKAQTICVDPSGVSVSEKFAVYIAQAASGANSVEVRSNSLDGVVSKC